MNACEPGAYRKGGGRDINNKLGKYNIIMMFFENKIMRYSNGI